MPILSKKHIQLSLPNTGTKSAKVNARNLSCTKIATR
ncbi:unnamed protein product, partial [Tenebrio molitor]